MGTQLNRAVLGTLNVIDTIEKIIFYFQTKKLNMKMYIFSFNTVSVYIYLLDLSIKIEEAEHFPSQLSI